MVLHKDTEALIKKQLKEKQEAVYVFLFKEYYNSLFRFAVNYIYDEDAAHDIVQELFIDLYEKGDTLNITSTIKSYLLTATKNRCLNFLRSVKIKDTHNKNILEAYINSDNLDSIEDNSLLEELQIVMNDLPPKVRDVFRLRVLEDYKFREIAEELKISENNAKVQMGNAIKVIREKFPYMKESFIVFLVHVGAVI